MQGQRSTKRQVLAELIGERAADAVATIEELPDAMFGSPEERRLNKGVLIILASQIDEESVKVYFTKGRIAREVGKSYSELVKPLRWLYKNRLITGRWEHQTSDPEDDTFIGEIQLDRLAEKAGLPSM